MTAPLRLVGVDPELLFSVWPKVSVWIAAACARPGCDLRPVELFVAAANQEAQLIVGLDDDDVLRAVAATQVCHCTDGSLSCWVLVVGGAADGWSAMLGEVEAGARRKGCDAVEFIGRRGWVRRLPGYSVSPHKAGSHFLKHLREAA
ncbi:hypothetical protein ASG52_24780 [Methylobacterium sp. Leaf456]|uniref:hypothetical protein n=1 Tax=Methylobacterium sp. Leaf456 TaxID=1736382 RepID=UPI0006F7BD01|nr:hypothetical protein [Methylobacterium sp. Leaf456]KQT55421.1 hypothetical protein ASG52_24780 [Methylobacterium sp. Leaf456]